MSIGFTNLSLFTALIFAGMALLFGVTIPRTPRLWQRLPRNRILGVVLVLVCLIWSSILIIPLLEGDLARFRVWIRLLVPIVTVLSFFFIDYLFTRAVGGLLLLLTADLIHGAFVVHLPLRPIYAIVCYAVGIAGMIMIGMPWLFRDLLGHAEQSVRVRGYLTGVCGGCALFFFVFGVLG